MYICIELRLREFDMELCVRLIVVFFVFIIGDINFVKFVDDNVVISIRYGLV